MANFKAVKESTSNDNIGQTETRRRYPRRAHDVCMVNVDGHPMPVVDWSQCGVLFEGDTRLYEPGQHLNMILRFKVGPAIEDVKVTGTVVRKNNHGVATTFDEIPETTLDTFDTVIAKMSA